MEYIKYIALYVCIIIGIWFIGTKFAAGISDYKIIKPAPDIQCVVVSRMFNTSVSCLRSTP